jgi:two-component system NtrC family sensor kinase
MAAELKKRRDEFESAYQKMSQMDRLSALGRLTAGIAHEINNPLGIISNYTQVLARNAKIDDETQQDIQIIQEEISRASEIIRRLLNFSGRSGTEKSMVWVNEILQKTFGLLKFQLKTYNISLVEEYDENLPFIVGNPTHLQQAFLNILLNAMEAMTEGGKLILGTKCRKNTVAGNNGTLIEVSIADTGHGIEKRYLDQIFDPFFTLKGQGQGTGLGLSITYGIIKEHGGSIDVDSRLNKGTVVKIKLPAFNQ